MPSKTLRKLSRLLCIEAPQRHPKQHFLLPIWCVLCFFICVKPGSVPGHKSQGVFHRDPSLHRSVCTVHRYLQSSNDPWPLPQNLWKNRPLGIVMLKMSPNCEMNSYPALTLSLKYIQYHSMMWKYIKISLSLQSMMKLAWQIGHVMQITF